MVQSAASLQDTIAQTASQFESKLRSAANELSDLNEQVQQRDAKLRDQGVTLERITAELKSVHLDLQREQYELSVFVL